MRKLVIGIAVKVDLALCLLAIAAIIRALS